MGILDVCQGHNDVRVSVATPYALGRVVAAKRQTVSVSARQGLQPQPATPTFLPITHALSPCSMAMYALHLYSLHSAYDVQGFFVHVLELCYSGNAVQEGAPK